MNEYTKIDDTTLKVVKPIEATTEEKTYDLDFLKSQEVSILKSKNDYCDARDKELAEVRELIAQCETLGVLSKTEVALEAATLRETNLIK